MHFNVPLKKDCVTYDTQDSTEVQYAKITNDDQFVKWYDFK